MEIIKTCAMEGLTNTALKNSNKMELSHQDVSWQELEKEKASTTAFLRSWHRQDVDWVDRLDLMFG